MRPTDFPVIFPFLNWGNSHGQISVQNITGHLAIKPPSPVVNADQNKEAPYLPAEYASRNVNESEGVSTKRRAESRREGGLQFSFSDADGMV